MDCLFCKIASKQIPAEVVYEEADAVAIFDVRPITRGHAMVLPKTHVQNILELPEEKIGPVFGAVKKVTLLLKEKYGPAGFTIGINHGRISGQAVDHLHIHIIPRYEGDGGGSLHSIWRQ